MCWPDHKVAVEIVDDPLAKPFDRKAHPDFTVLEVTQAELLDWEASLKFHEKLCRLLDAPFPGNDPEWRKANKRLHEMTFGKMRDYD